MKVVHKKKCYRLVSATKPAIVAALFALSLPAIDLGSQAAAADQNALLEILIRKGILTKEEAAQVQQEATAQEQQQKQEIVKDIQDKGVATPKALEGLKVEALGYVDYSAGKKGTAGDNQESYNKLTLTRGYLTVQKDINDWLGARITSDITRDATESWEMRIKYLYAQLKLGDLAFLSGVKSEIGQGHIPWLDFEEHVNPYRCQGTMAIERAGVFDSADLGVGILGDFGGKLKDAKALTGNSSYDGRYGSWHVGVYDGGGYHADEKNGNKLIEGRLSLRPMPDLLPGLQFSYLGITGDGNVKTDAPDYTANLGMISYEHPDFILTAQYFRTNGNAKGSWVYNDNDALETAGTSFFGAYHFPVLDRKLSIFGRYDHFIGDYNHDISNDDAGYDLYMTGLSYDIYKGNMVVLDYEWTSYDDNSGGLGNKPVIGYDLGDDRRMQVVYQFQF